ncbi:MAG: class II aldolase/adducin family protein [Alphaproteobacteria bacterium]
MVTGARAAALPAEMSSGERAMRVDLAATYRLVALYGWDDMIFTHISARVPGEEGHFLINPFGLLFEEITASSLIKVNRDGEVVGETDYAANQAGFVIHGAIHEAREDVGCVIHLHTDDGVAVSAQDHGLLPLSQHAMSLYGQLGYHDYEGVALDLDERERLARDLGDKPAMILRNHGTLAVGETCADAFMAIYYLERACAMQVRALAGGTAWTDPGPHVAERTASQSRPLFSGPAGDLAWPALLRRLDRVDPGFRD